MSGFSIAHISHADIHNIFFASGLLYDLQVLRHWTLIRDGYNKVTLGPLTQYQSFPDWTSRRRGNVSWIKKSMIGIDSMNGKKMSSDSKMSRGEDE